MPANIGEMFYTGEVPWHGEGTELLQPASLAEAFKAGGLNWDVGEVDMVTAEDSASPITSRKAIVRLDRPAGHKGRHLGVVDTGFTPVQNRNAALLFDEMFGRGSHVYHTGGYLGNGEQVWLLARIAHTLRIAGEDIVEPYALMANSHDGSLPFNIQLTTVRVVCQNTLAFAIFDERLGAQFRRAHQGAFAEHSRAAHEFFASTIRELDQAEVEFEYLASRRCSDRTFAEMVDLLVPDPPQPTTAVKYSWILWEKQAAEARAAREKITELRDNGKGASLNGSRGTYWGALNAILEFVDHYRPVTGSRIADTLLGDGMTLKTQAFAMIRQHARGRQRSRRSLAA